MQKPLHINFSSGPCAKHSNWSTPSCRLAGRSHRSDDGLKLIQDVISLKKKVLCIPSDYYVGIVSASSTGAVETLLWSLLGERGASVLIGCVFSNYWANDVVNELGITDVNLVTADFPQIPSTSNLDFEKDIVFCLSSTTSGSSFRDLDWIPNDRKGLTIADAASAAFTMDFDWTKLDAVAFSWQKGLGGEAGFGTIVLGPRAISRLSSYKPSRPMPRIFKIANNKEISFSLFNGMTINTPSMICLEDLYNNLLWADELGGIKGLVSKIEQNYSAVNKWMLNQNIFRFLVDEKIRSHHVVCLDIVSDAYQSMSEQSKWDFLKRIVAFCEKEKVGFDFLGHILTKPHLRIWAGATVDYEDLEKFLPWLELAYNRVK